MFAGFKRLIEDDERSFIGNMALGTGMTVGGLACYEMFEFAKANPALTVGLIKSFGAEFVIVVILMVFMNKLVGVLEKGAISNQSLADAVKQIADKDDRVAERLELLTQYNAQKADEAKESTTEILRRMSLHDSALQRIEHRQETLIAGQHVEKAS